MKELILGLDTSNYRSSAALISLEGEVLLNERLLLPVAAGERGLRQNEAVFLQVRQMRHVLEKVREAGQSGKIVAAACSIRPRDREDSYMPVFQVGGTLAHGIAAAMDIPCYETSHQMGHLLAGAHGTSLASRERVLAVHLSGGTTEMLLREGRHIALLGGTGDLHAGQLVDRIGVAMGLAFPAGPELETLAMKGRSEARLGCSLSSGDRICHFSGAETQAQRWLREGKPREDIAREIYDLLARTLARMLKAGRRLTGEDAALISGGVASSPLLRELLEKRMKAQDQALRLVFGEAELSSDNAVGVALFGAAQYREYVQEG